MTSVTDPMGNTTTYAYDHRSFLTTATQPAIMVGTVSVSPVTTYNYDNAGNLLSRTDPVGDVFTNEYDQLNRK